MPNYDTLLWQYTPVVHTSRLICSLARENPTPFILFSSPLFACKWGPCFQYALFSTGNSNLLYNSNLLFFIHFCISLQWISPKQMWSDLSLYRFSLLGLDKHVQYVDESSMCLLALGLQHFHLCQAFKTSVNVLSQSSELTPFGSKEQNKTCLQRIWFWFHYIKYVLLSNVKAKLIYWIIKTLCLPLSLDHTQSYSWFSYQGTCSTFRVIVEKLRDRKTLSCHTSF